MSSTYLSLFKTKKANKKKSTLKIVPFVFKGKELAPCWPFLNFSDVLLFKLYFSFGFLVWPVVPKLPQAYSRCGAAMVCTWFSLKLEKDYYFWLNVMRPSILFN